MIDIEILVENTSISEKFKHRHGLSIMIRTNDSAILLDTGPDKTFISNAAVMKIDLSAVDYLVLSHAHIDHTGGLKAFTKINKSAAIYLADNPLNKYYFRIKKYLYLPIGIKGTRSINKRIQVLTGNTMITDNIRVIMSDETDGFRPSLNKYLYQKKDGIKVQDDFKHESTLVIIDKKELVLFNSCSHSGVSNIIESVRKALPGYKIRSFVGGMHLCNPGGNVFEDPENIEKLAITLAKFKINYYTGHCTGKIPFGILSKTPGLNIEQISTGMKLKV